MIRSDSIVIRSVPIQRSAKDAELWYTIGYVARPHLSPSGLQILRSMQLLHAITSTDLSGGGPIEGLLRLGGALESLGHSSEILCFDAPDAHWLAQIPFNTHALGPTRLGNYHYSPRWIPWLQDQSSAFDCVVIHGLWQFTGLGTWMALRQQPLPYVIYTHGMLDPWFKRAYPLKHLKKMLYWPAEYQVLRGATRVLFTCEQERILSRHSFWPYHCHEAVVGFGTTAPPGDPDAQRRSFFQQFPDLSGKRLLLFLGRIHPKKGCDLLIEAFARTEAATQGFHLVMAGPDQVGWVPQLQRQAESLGIAERITWTGMLTGDLKWGAVHGAEAFLLPSHQENFGLAVAECLACGVPVLISDQVHIWREIEADGAGLVAADTLEGTEQLLRSWMALDETQRQTMAQQGIHCFQTRFEVKQAAQNLVEAIQEGLSS